MKLPELDDRSVDRIVEMAWKDRTPFEAIEAQFNLQEKQVIALMRRSLSASGFKIWRKRVAGRKTKHLRKRVFILGCFKSKNQKS